MKEENGNHLELIESLLLQMGAPEQQARIMASQLLKRARQIADERKINLVEAVETLLKKVVDARKS